MSLTGSDISNYILSPQSTISMSILKKELYIGSVSVDEKTYDGLANATGTVNLDGVVGLDDVSAIGSFVFTDVNAGSSKTVHVTDIELTGKKAGNYLLQATTAQGEGTISKATYDMSGITFTGENLTYDGTMHSLAISGTLPSGVTVSYSDNNSNTNAGTYEVTASFTGDTTNFNAISSKTATLTIQKASMTGGLSINGTAKEGQTLTYNASLVGGSYPSYQWKRNGVSISGATGLTYTLVTADVGKTISITATATGINYTGSITSASTAIVVSNAPPAPAGTILAYNLTSASDQNIINLTGFVPNTAGLEAVVALDGSSYEPYQALAVDGRGRARIYVSGNAIANTSKVMVRVAAAGAVSAGSDKEITLGASRTLSVGDYYQGGIVAYLGSLSTIDSGTKQGLIAAESDQGSVPWYNGEHICIELAKQENDELGSGFTNSTAITAKQGEGITHAAGLARSHRGGSYSDWFLPSKGELTKLYENQTKIGGFVVNDGHYWSSSEARQSETQYPKLSYAAGKVFDQDAQWVYGKENPLLVRPVRYF